MKIEDENIDNMDEADLRQWASEAIDALKERSEQIAKLEVTDKMFEALVDVYQKRSFAVEELRSAAYQFVRS